MADKKILEKKLQEEVSRFKAVLNYTQKLLNEQQEPDDNQDLPGDLPPADPAAGGNPPPPPMDGGEQGGDLPPMDGGGLDAGGLGGGLDAGGDLPPADGEMPPAEGGDLPPMDDSSTEEIDITDLVNMTKSIKKELEDSKTDNGGVVSKMDDVFSKLGELEQKIAGMDNIISKIDSLGSKIESMKPPTPQEKLEMRSLDSYPFNQKPNEFFSQKQQEMKASGKNEYVLRKDDVTNYSSDLIKNTFNTEDSKQNDEFKF